jgi:hypothetical protein
MPGYEAVSFTSQGSCGVRLFVIPRDPMRRRRWEISCRRDKWRAKKDYARCEHSFDLMLLFQVMQVEFKTIYGN